MTVPVIWATRGPIDSLSGSSLVSGSMMGLVFLTETGGSVVLTGVLIREFSVALGFASSISLRNPTMSEPRGLAG